jgi:hypothetical protein
MRTTDVIIEIRPPKEGEPGIYRTISDRIITGKVRVPAAQADVTDAWRRYVAYTLVGPGYVSPPCSYAVDLAPEAPGLFKSIACFASKQNLPELTSSTPLDVLGCRAAPFHHDMEEYSNTVFCIVWMEKSRGLDLVFPNCGRRVPLQLGTVVIFDAGQPHGVIRSDLTTFFPLDYEELPAQTFLSLSFDIQIAEVRNALGINLIDYAPHHDGKFISKPGSRPKVNIETGYWE